MLKIAETTLSNGVKMPLVGLGVWTPERNDATEAVTFAIQNGYRSIDTAAGYRNEDQVGRGIKESGVAREDIFITTKVANGDQGYDSTLRAFEASLKNLGTDYVDLYLIHWPDEDKSLDTWKAFEKLYEEKQVRAIGLSNFLIKDLEKLQAVANIMPVVNQIEFHPHLTRPDLVEYCQNLNIQMEAWSPLMKGQLDVEVLKTIAGKYNKTVAQVILRWDIQKGFVTIPKSFNKERIIENASIFDFELTKEEVDQISALNKGEHLPPPVLDKSIWK